MLSNQRIQNLDESLNKLLESRQKKIEVLEATLKDVRNDNASLKQNMEVQKLKSGGNNQVMEIQLKTVVTERDELRADLAKVYTYFLGKIELKISSSEHKEGFSNESHASIILAKKRCFYSFQLKEYDILIFEF